MLANPSKGLIFFKTLSYILATVFVLAGAVTVAFGLYLTLTLHAMAALITTNLPLLAAFLGLLVLATTFLGCFGSVTENRLIILSYCFVMLGIITTQYLTSVAGYRLVKNSDEIATLAWQNITTEIKISYENEFECCGWVEGDCPNQQKPLCSQIIMDYFKSNIHTMNVLCLVSASSEILCVLFSFLLFYYLAKERSFFAFVD
eukprot:TRINITY_DN711_c1_g2_i1.p1 TRINITY_DN711_c1_g2~~TRINITY_DN711_c1_g2_i1.p1  ORF type:complete len:203 (-),score=64.57 TRINITY_DN711_c1_g2_i1:80-688(-)